MKNDNNTLILTEIYLVLQRLLPNDLIRIIYGIIVQFKDLIVQQFTCDILEELRKLCRQGVGYYSYVGNTFYGDFSDLIWIYKLECGTGRYYNRKFPETSIDYKVYKIELDFNEEDFRDYRLNKEWTRTYFEKKLSDRPDMIISKSMGNNSYKIHVERRITYNGEILQSQKK